MKKEKNLPVPTSEVSEAEVVEQAVSKDPIVRSQGTVLQMIKVQTPLHSSLEQKKKILKSALEELELCPSLAEKSYYTIPFKNRKTNEVVNIQGPSVSSARTLRRLWGNCAAQAVILNEDDEYVTVEGRFVDAETNTMYATQLKVPKFYYSSDTHQKIPLTGDALTKAIQAGLSKAERNATFACLPDWLKEMYYQKAREIAVGYKKGKRVESLDKVLEKIISSFQVLGVSKEMIDQYINMKGGLTEEVVADLRGIYNAISEGEAKIEEIFVVKKEEKQEEGEIKKDQLL